MDITTLAYLLCTLQCIAIRTNKQIPGTTGGTGTPRISVRASTAEHQTRPSEVAVAVF